MGKQIGDPEISEDVKKEAYQQAILNVPLWKELRSFPNLPKNIWYSIRRVTGLGREDSEEIDERVRDWYVQDNRFVENQSVVISANDYSSDTNTNSMSEQVLTNKIERPSGESRETQVIKFGDMTWTYPKSVDVKTAWQEFSDHIQIHFKYNIDSKKNQSTSAEVQQEDESP